MDEHRIYKAIGNLIDILGESYLDRNGASKYSDVFFPVQRFVGIYFGACWAAPCQEFDPMLVEFYNKVNQVNKQIEIIYVSSDEDASQFNAMLSKFPFLSIPYNDARLMELKAMYAITAVPVLVIIRKDGTVVTTNGRNDIYQFEEDAIDHWE